MLVISKFEPLHEILNHKTMLLEIAMFLKMPVLTLLFSGNVVMSMSNISKYNRIEAMDGLKCQSSYIVFYEKNIGSITECLKLCSSLGACAGASYEISTKQCIGCDWQFHTSNGADVFADAMYFQLNDCPNGNGRIHPEINFRLQIYTDRKSQSDAADTCKRELNGHLVVIDEERKMTTVSNILTSCPGFSGDNDYWADGSCVNSTYKFTDEREMSMMQTTFWMENKPDGFTSCVRLRKNKQVYRWDDKECREEYRFICQY